MQSCRVSRAPSESLRLQLTDFNRLRWTVAALRGHAITTQACPLVVDSTWLLREPQWPVPEGAQVVLWDGLNSLHELRQARADLASRHDLRFLVVGNFSEIADAFPETCTPLFPALASRTTLTSRSEWSVPGHVDALSWLRARLRPLKNRRLMRSLHDRLQRGGQLVFCGLVRPTEGVLDNFFRDATLQDLRGRSRRLVGFDWRQGASVTRDLCLKVHEALRTAHAASAADWASLYSVLALLHRLCVLAMLHDLSPRLVVTEYGVDPHFDPYDAHAYARNLFIDFGSTRGPDLVYPRTVDLLLQSKPHASLRLISSAESLQEFIEITSPTAFWTRCEHDAIHLVDRLTPMTEV